MRGGEGEIVRGKRKIVKKKGRIVTKNFNNHLAFSSSLLSPLFSLLFSLLSPQNYDSVMVGQDVSGTYNIGPTQPRTSTEANLDVGCERERERRGERLCVKERTRENEHFSFDWFSEFSSSLSLSLSLSSPLSPSSQVQYIMAMGNFVDTYIYTQNGSLSFLPPSHPLFFSHLFSLFLSLSLLFTSFAVSTDIVDAFLSYATYVNAQENPALVHSIRYLSNQSISLSLTHSLLLSLSYTHLSFLTHFLFFYRQLW
jgi:hypothetical protein